MLPYTTSIPVHQWEKGVHMIVNHVVPEKYLIKQTLRRWEASDHVLSNPPRRYAVNETLTCEAA